MAKNGITLYLIPVLNRVKKKSKTGSNLGVRTDLLLGISNENICYYQDIHINVISVKKLFNYRITLLISTML